jgi:hypothetical protein
MVDDNKYVDITYHFLILLLRPVSTLVTPKLVNLFNLKGS